MNFNESGTIFISCGKGLSPYLEQELNELGFSALSLLDTGVEINGTLNDAIGLNLRLRTAMSVLFLLKKFPCVTVRNLYDNIYDYPWEKLISQEEYICVISRTQTEAITNTMFANQKVKDAIVDRLQKIYGSRPDSGPNRDHLVINLHWHGQRGLIYLNTTGKKLSDRGYRLLPHTAPLQETLAAAILRASGYDGTQTLILPMCGSGTLACEAGLIALNKAPGLLRNNYSFLHMKNFISSNYEKMREELRKKIQQKPLKKIIAGDIDPQAVNKAKQNAKTAGVFDCIEFHTCDYTQTPIPDDNGIIILNPEYGMRLGDSTALEATYKNIGDFFKQKCSGYSGYIFTGTSDLIKKIGLRAKSRRIFFNADIECRLLEYELYQGSKKTKKINTTHANKQ